MRLIICLFVVFSFALPAFSQTVEDGYAAYDAGDYEKAKSIIMPLAEAGDPKALNAMGIFYSQGKMFEANRKTACDWYEKSANKGFPAAMNNYAWCFSSEKGRKHSDKQLLYWMNKAADSSYLIAQLFLLDWYLERDKTVAKKWATLAAEHDNTAARVILWWYGLDVEYRAITFIDVACVIIKISILDQNINSCDSH